jgi:hypothetical protein
MGGRSLDLIRFEEGRSSLRTGYATHSAIQWPQLHCIGSTERLPTRANRRFIESQSAKDAAIADSITRVNPPVMNRGMGFPSSLSHQVTPGQGAALRRANLHTTYLVELAIMPSQSSAHESEDEHLVAEGFRSI